MMKIKKQLMYGWRFVGENPSGSLGHGLYRTAKAARCAGESAIQGRKHRLVIFKAALEDLP